VKPAEFSEIRKAEGRERRLVAKEKLSQTEIGQTLKELGTLIRR